MPPRNLIRVPWFDPCASVKGTSRQLSMGKELYDVHGSIGAQTCSNPLMSILVNNDNHECSNRHVHETVDFTIVW